jgi:hypothetical protein
LLLDNSIWIYPLVLFPTWLIAVLAVVGTRKAHLAALDSTTSRARVAKSIRAGLPWAMLIGLAALDWHTSLSHLGFGLQPPDRSIGMLAFQNLADGAHEGYRHAPYAATIGVLLFSAVVLVVVALLAGQYQDVVSGSRGRLRRSAMVVVSLAIVLTVARGHAGLDVFRWV